MDIATPPKISKSKRLQQEQMFHDEYKHESASRNKSVVTGLLHFLLFEQFANGYKHCACSLRDIIIKQAARKKYIAAA